MVSDTQELPEIGEIVIATITKISDHGAYVTLDEYNKIQGFVHVSEIAPGWVRKVHRYVRSISLLSLPTFFTRRTFFSPSLT